MRIVCNWKNNNENNKKIQHGNRIDLSTNFSSDTRLKRKVHQIQLLVGVTQADFYLLYVEIVKNLRLWYKPYLDDILKEVIKALKRRRGYLLPVGSDSEISFREHEVWTYAIFTASILKFILSECPDQSLDKIKELIPKQGLLWLKRHPVLIEQWNAYFLNQDTTVFTQLIDIRLMKEPTIENDLFSVD